MAVKASWGVLNVLNNEGELRALKASWGVLNILDNGGRF